MAFAYSGSFNYFLAARPLATVQLTTGTFDYFRGIRPIPIAASAAAPPPATSAGALHSWFVKGIGIKTKGIIVNSQVNSDTGDTP